MYTPVTNRMLLALNVCLGVSGAVPALAQVPFSVTGVSVECNGECTDLTLGDVCGFLGTGFTPISIDCSDVDDDGRTTLCRPGDNFCSRATVNNNAVLSAFCRDTDGWDASVFCAR